VWWAGGDWVTPVPRAVGFHVIGPAVTGQVV